ncbi:MAG: hypothetical protein JXA73_09705 [Acidobacteria bacterium]|nr:hypothetical protein [Acidobacteriota bacterium]
MIFQKGKHGTTRREFVRETGFGAAGLALAGPLAGWAEAAAKKYQEYFHELRFKKGEGGPGCADHIVELSGKNLNNRNTSFSFGYFSKPGAYKNEARVHPYDSCLAFVGLDSAKPDYLGAEIEVSLGSNFEKYAFSIPTIICLPKDVPIGPIVARKVDKPYAHYEIGLQGACEATRLPAPTKYAETKEHEHLIKKLSDSAMGDAAKYTGPGNAFWISWPRSKALEGFNVNFTWGYYKGLGNWHREGFDPHVHVGDEFLVFVGLDAGRPQYLGSELDMYMGPEKELFAFSRPMVIVCPSMFVHAPIISKKVEQIYAFFLIRTDKGDFTQKKTPEGYPIQ